MLNFLKRLFSCKTAGVIHTGKLYKAHPLDAGQDIFANEAHIIPPNGRRLVSTGLHISLPPSHVGLIWSRSGLALYQGLEIGAGCIDEAYTGEVKVLLFNHGSNPVEIYTGERIAQLLTIPINNLPYRQASCQATASSASGRGTEGFGSTGAR